MGHVFSNAVSQNQSTSTESSLISRNVKVLGRRTSVRLEPEMWDALNEIAIREKCTIHDLCTLINTRKDEKSSLTASIRVFLMLYYKSAATKEGHERAGHGNIKFMMHRGQVNGMHLNINAEKSRYYASSTTSASAGY